MIFRSIGTRLLVLFRPKSRSRKHSNGLGFRLNRHTTAVMRFGIYAALCVALFQCLLLCVPRLGAEVIGSEQGPVELAQGVLALVAAIYFFYAAAFSDRGMTGFLGCGVLLAYASAREQDWAFESLFFDDAYKWLVGLPFAITLGLVMHKRRKDLADDLKWMVGQPCFVIFATAGIYLVSVCQILDKPELWSGISSHAEAMQTKAMIEEICELFAYAALMISGVEAVVYVFLSRNENSAKSRRDNERSSVFEKKALPRGA